MRSPCITLIPVIDTTVIVENWRRAADTAPLQSHLYLYAIGDLDEGNTTGHAVLFAIKSHDAVETARRCSFALARKIEFSFFVTPRMVKLPSTSNVFGPV